MSITTINAGPGTGKTFVLNNGYRILSNNVMGNYDLTPEQSEIFKYFKDEYNGCKSFCFFAHSNSAKDNLIRRLPPKTKVQTFHGAGMSAIIRNHRYQKYDQTRSDRHITDLTGQYLRNMNRDEKLKWLFVKKLCHYLKLETLKPSTESLDYIRLKYADISVYPIPDDWEDRATKLLAKSTILDGSVEFVDMLWLGLKSIRQPFYDLGFVDESQDISRCAYEMLSRMCRNLVFCGDKNQAINAFAGASEEMYDSISGVSDAILPLKMTLRCPPFICEMANSIRQGGIVEGPNKDNGQHETINYTSLPRKIQQECTPKQTMIIARTNQAIINCALYLHQAKVPCKIVDKDLADEVKAFFGQFFTKNLSTLRVKIDTYEAQYAKSRNPLWAQMCSDKAAYARNLLDSVKTWDQLVNLIEELFKADSDGYTLSTIHKAKGLEAKNVFILNPPIELPAAMEHPIGREQEINLHFVALTRSSKNLYWVTR